MRKDWAVTPTRIATVLFAFTGLLLIANLISIYLFLYLHRGYRLAWMFFFDKEGNVPHYWSFFLMILAVMMIAGISSLKIEAQKKMRQFWRALCFLFIFLTINHFFGLHNKFRVFSIQLFESYSPREPLHYSWVIPYALIIGITCFVLLKDFFRLPVRIQLLFFLSAAFFLMGAIVLDITGSQYSYRNNGGVSLLYFIIATGEELLEITGMNLFIYTLCIYYTEHIGENSITVSLRLQRDSAVQQMDKEKEPLTSMYKP
jgi:hypothetical protein